MGLLDMMLHIADENAREFRQRDARAGAGQTVTAAMLEDLEWESFKSHLHRQKALLNFSERDEDAATTGDGDANEDDIDMLLFLADVLESAKIPLTLSEIVRQLQQDKVLSLEFTATARAQTKRLLTKMRAMNKVWQDTQGRWSKL